MSSSNNELLILETVVGSLNKKMQLFEPVLETIEEGIEIVDEKGLVHFVNNNFTKLSGIDASERMHKNILDVNPNGIIAEVIRTKNPKINILTTTPGREGKAITSCHPLFIDGEFVGAIAIFKDISQVVDLSIRMNQQQSYLTEIYRQTARYVISDIVAEDKKMKDIIAKILKIAGSSLPIALLGEPGVGKDVIAEAIHLQSPRNNKPFIRFDCTEISDNEIKYRLFGYEKNAFPEAMANKVGCLELANGGTLYLDYLDKLSMPVQAELIHALKAGKAVKIGGHEEYLMDLRIIASLNTSLVECYENGFLHEELFHYLHQTCIEIPPLRERKQDIPNLVNIFLKCYNQKFGKNIKRIEKEAIETLVDYSWYGNVKELKNVIRQIVMEDQDEIITKKIVLDKLPAEYSENFKNGIISLEEAERNMIVKALNHYGHTLKGKKQAANVLGVSLGTLYNKMRDYQIQ